MSDGIGGGIGGCGFCYNSLQQYVHVKLHLSPQFSTLVIGKPEGRSASAAGYAVASQQRNTTTDLHVLGNVNWRHFAREVLQGVSCV
jgi:hypothetical protein